MVYMPGESIPGDVTDDSTEGTADGSGGAVATETTEAPVGLDLGDPTETTAA